MFNTNEEGWVGSTIESPKSRRA